MLMIRFFKECQADDKLRFLIKFFWGSVKQTHPFDEEYGDSEQQQTLTLLLLNIANFCSDVSNPSTYGPSLFISEPDDTSFMNKYAISPKPPSNAKGSDFSGRWFTFEWDIDFPYEGEYVFHTARDNRSSNPASRNFSAVAGPTPGKSSILTSPAVGSINLDKHLTSGDFPLPERPITTNVSPF